ncbi:chorismate mutase type II [Pseudonocardia autotrophica]|uniref:Isochorismate-pyruvate lyase n=2 Tax=Pseudonocardia TaxID=1847 RepID=A0A1Y2N3V3_PSEAH|nr:isochorismate-pyruvate lyase [Pseudonocardia autotrophica]TDN71523.1 chorismate mutase type II [Pseudonocardia autotrophica]BBG02202.1 hypothetical protein Pdca_34110 [Pseudonocardia autotrophica]GEC24216.1 hypothetical protein PSA01_12450 [Pseudonocardia saturnea]
MWARASGYRARPEAATYKRDDAAVRAPARRAALMARLRERGMETGLSPSVVDATWTAMIDAFVGLELNEHRQQRGDRA